MRGMCTRRVSRSNVSLAIGFLITVSLLGLFAAIWALYEPDISIHRGMKASQDSVDFRREIAEQLAVIAKELIAPERDGLGDIIFRLSRIISRLDPRYELSDEESIPQAPSNASRTPTTDAPTIAASSKRYQSNPGVYWKGDGQELVCDERYMSERHGYPFFDTGFVAQVGCPGEQPLHLVVTVLFVLEEGFGEETSEERLQTVLSGVREYDPSMQVLVAAPRVTEQMREMVTSIGTGALFEYANKSSGEAWNILASHTTTPFVLLARDLTHFHPTHTRLRRQVRVLSGAVVVAGGATRNEEGKWNMGCLQSQMRGYTLRFTRGYRISARDCMLCDHLEGPFVTRTSVLLAHPFSKAYPVTEYNSSFLGAVTFADWFLRLKQAGFLALGCPDVMYYVLGGTRETKGPKKFHGAWLWLAIQWELTAIVNPPFPNPLNENIPHFLNFSCPEVGLTCKASRLANRGHLMPPCCSAQVVAAISALEHFASSHAIRYEMEAGSALGAVKMGSFIPWDVDGDITFESKDYSLYYKESSWFKERGMSLSSFEDPVPMHKESPETSPKTKGYFCLYTPDIYIEMWGYHKLSVDTNATPEAVSERAGPHEGSAWKTLPLSSMLPTRIHLKAVGDPKGVWARVISNPGLFARNRYGSRFLRHAQSWMNLGMGDSWQSYAGAAGGWWGGSRCSRMYHHACLVHYPTDGNLNFYDDGHV